MRASIPPSAPRSRGESVGSNTPLRHDTSEGERPFEIFDADFMLTYLKGMELKRSA